MSFHRLVFGAALALTFVTTGNEAYAEEPQVRRDFEAANDRALKGDWKEATGLYQSLVDRGVHHPDVLYNLGNAYAASKHPVEAIVAYERALRRDPNHEDARANLEALRAQLRAESPRGQANLDEQTVALVDVLGPLVRSLPRAPFAWGVLVAQLLLFGGWWLARRASSTAARRRFFALAWLGLAATLCTGLVTYGHYLVWSDPIAVARTATELQQGPDERFESAGPVARGARLRIVGRDGSWSKVVQPDGTSGWLPSTDVLRVTARR